MSRDDVIEKAAQVLAKATCVPQPRTEEAQAPAEAGLLVDELPPEPLPLMQVRQAPDGAAWQKLDDPGDDCPAWWSGDGPQQSLSDDKVRDWTILVPADRVIPERSTDPKVNAQKLALDIADRVYGVPGSFADHVEMIRDEIVNAETDRRGEQA